MYVAITLFFFIIISFSSYLPPVFLVREHGRYWTKPVKISSRTIDALKEGIIKTLRPKCKDCSVCAIYNKYNKALKVKYDSDVKFLPSYSELEANIIDF